MDELRTDCPDRSTPESLLVVAAHPDDIEFCVSGTVMQWIARGTRATYCIVTDGDAGGYDDRLPRQAMADLRRAEQVHSAKLSGIQDVRFLGYPDSLVEPSVALRRDLCRVIREVRPQRAIIPSPEINWKRLADLHPDHRAVGEAALRAVYPEARNPFAYPELLGGEGLEPWIVPELWLMTGPTPNQYVDVTSVFSRKVDALRIHTSQTAHFDDLAGLLHDWLSEHAQAAGLPPGRLAEAFQIVATG
ncbi:PIG-L deacetylase family protein [Streptomyces sp. NBC_01306]|uniref:PIG-L deacetylase family protein n=1 Tax=Streptomyces sp. NBC_01306 TaxID=2903819 RepID=UPI00224D4FB5|nr:PIG-L deacetylase family protein [Streptomyces sp. NBC_01306]MCX4729134.1 PIG-L family deacetylase [Streptomyces sp. NBC_01306]